MRAADDRPFRLRSPAQTVDAERLQARFASWYELFPRSQTDDAGRHGTFQDVIARLPHVRAMGFDVLYFPPIHPIGRKNRKGRNNSLTPGPGRSRQPYAIGSAEGGHEAIHPELGAFEDFRRLVAAAAEQGLEIALDFAIQCSPDHPWLREHPGWFDWRPDGSIKYAENPPKKYQDIVNVDFYKPEADPRAVVGAPRQRAAVGGRRRAAVPGGQPAHQAAAVLGVDDRRGPRRPTPTWSSSPRPSPGPR